MKYSSSTVFLLYNFSDIAFFKKRLKPHMEVFTLRALSS